LVLETRSNFKVLTASDPVFGYPIARAERPDLIILDVIMPFEDGFTASRQFKDDPDLFDVPIIILTGFSGRLGETSISVAQGMDLAADDYMEKPVNPDELLKRVSELLKKSKRNF
jgi:DNA-binding response OmpR family regulator